VKDRVSVTATAFDVFDGRRQRAIARAAERYAAFLGLRLHDLTFD